MNICTIFWNLSLNIAETERMLLLTVEEEKSEG